MYTGGCACPVTLHLPTEMENVDVDCHSHTLMTFLHQRQRTVHLSFQPHSDHTFTLECLAVHTCSNFTTVIFVMLPLIDKVLQADTFQDVLTQCGVYFGRQQFKVIIFSTDRSLFLKLRHSSVESDVADEETGSQGSTTSQLQNLDSTLIRHTSCFSFLFLFLILF